MNEEQADRIISKMLWAAFAGPCPYCGKTITMDLHDRDYCRIIQKESKRLFDDDEQQMK